MTFASVSCAFTLSALPVRLRTSQMATEPSAEHEANTVLSTGLHRMS